MLHIRHNRQLGTIASHGSDGGDRVYRGGIGEGCVLINLKFELPGFSVFTSPMFFLIDF